MKILFISSLLPSQRVVSLFQETGHDPGFQVQNFCRLVATGMADNGAQVTALSAIANLQDAKKRIRFWKNYKEDNINYHFIPFINVPGLRYLLIFICTFFYVLFWGIGKRKDKRIVCDSLNLIMCLAVRWATIINRVKTCGHVTDLLYILNNTAVTTSKSATFTQFIYNRYIHRFDFYIFLTRAMNDVINIHHHPFIIMEGLCKKETSPNPSKNKKKSIMYAGQCHKLYGLEVLIQAFAKAELPDDITLDLYGTWTMDANLKSLHPNIRYHGVVSSQEIDILESEAMLLVNPRFSTEEFTKYSFPSKTMEYMLSGTPVLMTPLPGMPEEYYRYVYLFDEETIEGYAQTLKKIVNLPQDELNKKGKEAQQFVLKNKNCKVQMAQILDFLKN